jgi:phosphate transport system protein
MALHQPVASDLRVARAVARAALELERVGDESKKIARFAAKVGSVAPHDPVAAVARSLRHMATLSTALLRNAVRALDEANVTLAREVLERDRELDEEFAAALRQVMSFAIEDQQFLRATMDTVFALKGLERIGDHAKNVSEQVLYMVEGERPRKPARK